MATVTVIQPTIAEEQNTKIRCAAYCRVSSDSEDQLNSFLAQTRYYEKAFENSETEQLVDIYADEGITGTCEDKRDEFQRMIKDCRKGKIDRIYTKSISRFARNTKDCLKNIRELKSLGITVFFEKENIDTAKLSDEMMITIMGGLAQEESTSISKNMRWSIKKRMESGTMKMCNSVFGYNLVNGELIINKDEAQTVKKIFEWYLDGYGSVIIAKKLNDMSIGKRGRSCHWTSYTIRTMLQNEKYIGDQMFQKRYTTSTLPYKNVPNKGELPKYYYTGRHEAIISKDVFDRVQELMKNRRKEKTYEIKGNVLGQKIKCGECGSTFRMKRCRDKIYWACRLHIDEIEKCSVKQIAQNDIYEAFIRLCNKLLYNYKQILLPLQTTLQDLRLRKFSGQTQVMDIHKEIAKLKEQTHVLARLKTKGFLDEAKYIEQTNELNVKISKLQSELKKLTRSDNEDETLEQIEMLTDFFEKREKPMTEFEETTFESIVDKIVVKSQNELEFHLIGGLKFKEKI